MGHTAGISSLMSHIHVVTFSNLLFEVFTSILHSGSYKLFFDNFGKSGPIYIGLPPSCLFADWSTSVLPIPFITYRVTQLLTAVRCCGGVEVIRYRIYVHAYSEVLSK